MKALSYYRLMRLIRRFEERLLLLFREGELRGTAHVCVGQEAVAVGTLAGLKPWDRVVSNHRGHGHMLARGADPKRVMAEMFGKRDGYALGRGGSQHLAAFECGFLGANGITGGGLPIAAGSALAHRLRGVDCVTAAFHGDGASAQGAFHEAVNLAAVWRLPVIFLCENNQYAMGTPVRDTCPAPTQADRARGYGLIGTTCDGNDVFAVRDAVAAARARMAADAGGGPEIVEAVTYRRAGHSRSDPAAYRPAGELERWIPLDPLERLRQRLRESGEARAEEFDRIDAGVEAELDAALAFARASEPLPAEAAALNDPGMGFRFGALPEPPARGTMNRNAGALPCAGRRAPGTESRSYARSLYEAMAQALAADPSVVLMGEDIADYRGAFRVTDDLYQRFGRDRVRNTPISENGIVGAGLGLALEGFRPVVEIMFMDFLLLAFDQLANHAAKFPWLHGGRPLPLVIRTPSGGRRGYGATHSQCFETLLLSIPGLRVFTPATPRDAYDLLLEAIRGDLPTVVVEHKLLYGRSELFDPDAAPMPAGRARVAREGSDVTFVTFSEMVVRALTAAERLAGEGISAEVIDLRTLAPLDFGTVAASASKTQRVIVGEEGVRAGGVGSEIAARLQEECFGFLDAPVLRLGAQSAPLAAAESLERAALPWEDDWIAAARGVMG